MLTELHLENFKCFESLDLRLRPLTLLSGVNGGGKSSVIQSLVLLSHMLTRDFPGDKIFRLVLETADMALGSAGDVLNQSGALEMRVATATHSATWTFVAEEQHNLSLKLSNFTAVDGARDLLQTLRSVSWISAERTGPRELLPLLDATRHQYVGARGELAAGLLYWHGGPGDRPVSAKLQVADFPPTLFHQVRAHMQQFFPGCDFVVSPIDGASAVKLRLRSTTRTDFLRPQNVGFGLTQLFPVLVAALAAQPGDVLLIENPEVHLHPKAQQNIGFLLAQVAATGVQVLVETHSDHVLNGIRLAVKSKSIPAADCAVHFFMPGKVESPAIDEDGKLDSWPEGFFDQFDQALSELL